jgi:hypothetical protein
LDFVGGADSGCELKAVLCEQPAIRGKANSATTAFAGSPVRASRAHSLPLTPGIPLLALYGVGDGCYERVVVIEYEVMYGV